MATALEQCLNQECARTFIIHRFSLCFAKGDEVGKTNCPYCGIVRWADPSNGYRSEVLSPESEKWLEAVTNVKGAGPSAD